MSSPRRPDQPQPRSVRRAITTRAAFAIERGRADLAERAYHTLSPGRRRTLLTLPYPPAAANEARYGHGKPSHARLAQLLARGDTAYGEVLASFEPYREALAAIPAEQTDPLQPHWHNTLLFGLDGISLYCFTRERRPRRYVEVGSGNSTLFVNRARRDGELEMRITSVDPVPRREIDQVCDEIIRAPFESVGLDLFEGLAAGDIVYFDCSHRVFMNSDVTAFFLDVLPELPPGVLVGIHDIYLPDDYKSEHHARWWSEQYILAALLLGEPSWLRTLLPCWYVESHAELGDRARSLQPAATYSRENPHGLIFWLETLARG
jgi:hypothetical protein